MNKKIYSVLLLALLTLLISSCTLFKGAEHTHEFGVGWSYSSSEHYRACECGERIDADVHLDREGDGLCDTCGYRVSEPAVKYTVPLTADEGISVTPAEITGEIGSTVYITAVVPRGYLISAEGAECLGLLTGYTSTEGRILTYTFAVMVSENTGVILTKENAQDSVITYCTYGGAVGDGVADDFDAIEKTHKRANITGQTVVADPGKTFYMGQHFRTVSIQTDTVWTDATFIIDDSSILPNDLARSYNVFRISPDRSSAEIRDITSLKAGQTNVGRTFEGDVLLRLENSMQRQYIRYGVNGDNGAAQQEIILVDKDGNVDPSTPILWDYDVLTSVVAYYVDDTPITVTGGHFITIANQAPRKYTYYSRGIAITRSNVTMTGQYHEIRGEGEDGAPYNGFVSVSYANNVLFDSITFTGHKTYAPVTNSSDRMGTYDISANSANNVTWRNCTQTNSITDTAYWGVMGSNYCKNLTYDGCVLSRFDAHKGTHNATIINSEIGHQRINIIGSGVLVIENTTVNSNQLINLRDDYGSTWRGDVIIRNVKLNNTSTPTLIHGVWRNHYFGYTCHLPENVTIDGITLAKGSTFYILPNLSSSVDDETISGAVNNNPYVLTKKVYVVSNPNGYTFYVSKNSTLFGNTQVIK